MSDQYVDPFVIVDDAGQPVGPVQDGDAVVLFNFRADRMVEMSKAFEYEDFTHFDRVRYPKVGSRGSAGSGGRQEGEGVRRRWSGERTRVRRWSMGEGGEV